MFDNTARKELVVATHGLAAADSDIASLKAAFQAAENDLRIARQDTESM